jgi:hypothetical protein
MATFEVAVTIKAPPARIIAVLCDVERWPEWTPTVTSAKRLDSGPLVEGSQARLLQPRLPAAIWKVTAFDSQRGFAWVSRSPVVQTTGEHWVEPADEGSRVSLSLRFSGLLGWLFARLYRDLSERYLATEAQGLRTRCERENLDRGTSALD